MIESILKQLNLTDKEIAIYLALLPIGKAPASVLGKRTGIARSTAQYICHQLKKKGIIQSIKKNNGYIYYVDSPEKLLLLVEKGHQTLNKAEIQVMTVMSDLHEMINPEATLPKMQYYSGEDGIIKLFKDVLKSDEPLFGAWYIDMQINTNVSEYTSKKWLPELKKQNRSNYSIVNNNPATLEYLKDTTDVNQNYMLIDESTFPFAACCHIYGDKVVFYSYRNNDLTGVLIKNEKIRQTQLALFYNAWEGARHNKINEDRKDLELPPLN